jgi:hypothetical protein
MACTKFVRRGIIFFSQDCGRHYHRQTLSEKPQGKAALGNKKGDSLNYDTASSQMSANVSGFSMAASYREHVAQRGRHGLGFP